MLKIFVSLFALSALIGASHLATWEPAQDTDSPAFFASEWQFATENETKDDQKELKRDKNTTRDLEKLQNDAAKKQEKLDRDKNRTVQDAARNQKQLDQNKNRTIEHAEREIQRKERETRSYAARNASKSAGMLTNLTQGARQTILQALKNELVAATTEAQIKVIAKKYCVDEGCPNGTRFHLDTRYEFALDLAQLNDSIIQARAKASRFGPAGLAAIQSAETTLADALSFLNGALANPSPYSNATKQLRREKERIISNSQKALRKAFEPLNDLVKLRLIVKPILLNRTAKAVDFYRNLTLTDVSKGILQNATPVLDALNRMESEMIQAIHAEVDAANSTGRLNKLHQGFCDNSNCRSILSLHSDFVYGQAKKAQILAEFLPYANQENLSAKVGEAQRRVGEFQSFLAAVGPYAFDYKSNQNNPIGDDTINRENRTVRNESERNWVEAQKRLVDTAMDAVLPTARIYWQEGFSEKKAKTLGRVQRDIASIENQTARVNTSPDNRTRELMIALLNRAQSEVLQPLKRDIEAATTSAQVQTARKKYCIESGCPTGINFHLDVRTTYTASQSRVMDAENDTQRYPQRDKVALARTALDETKALIEALGPDENRNEASSPAQKAIRKKLTEVNQLLNEAMRPLPQVRPPGNFSGFPEKPPKPTPTITPNATLAPTPPANATALTPQNLTGSSEKPNRNYYTKLGKRCAERNQELGLPNETTCCIQSVNAMQLDGARESKKGTCEEGQQLQVVRCPGAYQWCKDV